MLLTQCIQSWAVCELHEEAARGEIRLSGSIIAAIKLRCCSIAHNQCWGGKLTAE